MEREIVLYKDKKDCCGCGGCATACPKEAITMKPDKIGMVYPEIDEEKCVCCGLCQRVCAFRQVPENNTTQVVYALTRKDKEKVKESASGGVFAAVAEQWIKQGGIVFGAALLPIGDTLKPCHIAARTEEELLPLLGSKYVQSDLGTTFCEARNLLENGKKVLFSGTPCQIAGLKKYLKKDYEELLTIDLICHGVPSTAMFQEYIKVENRKLGGTIQDFRFRDKQNGWGLNAKIVYCVNGKQHFLNIPSYKSSYYEMFLSGEIYRENCYSCPYANANHPADFTIGDYWGIEKEHPDYLQPQGMLNQSDGISVMIVNTKKGIKMFERFKEDFWYYHSTFQNAAEHNEQLKQPSKSGPNREKILSLYSAKGYRAVDRWFWKRKRKEELKQKILYHVHYNISLPAKSIVKKILRR